MSYDAAKYQDHEWLTRVQLDKSAISTAMKKVLKTALDERAVSCKRKKPPTEEKGKQKKITSFFIGK